MELSAAASSAVAVSPAALPLIAVIVRPAMTSIIETMAPQGMKPSTLQNDLGEGAVGSL